MATKTEFNVFLVDDDNMFLKMLEENLSSQRAKYKINYKTFSSGEECLNNLHLNPDLIVLDYYLDKKNSQAMNGIEILKKIKEKNPEQEVIMLSGQDKIEVAVETMKHGAFDYVVKNESAFIRSFNVISNIIKSMKSLEMLKAYRFGFYFLLSIIISIILIALIIVIFFPQLLQNYEAVLAS